MLRLRVPHGVSPWMMVPPLALAAFNNIALKIEAADRPVWVLTTEELSSIGLILALAPLLIMLARARPLSLRPDLRTLVFHAGGSLVFSLLHVIGMTAIRHLIFAAAGAEYRPGPPLDAFLCEYAKDAVVYALVIACIGWFDRRFAGPVAADAKPAPAFAVKTARGTVFVPPGEILRVEAAGNYATLVTPAGSFLHRVTMREVEAALPPDRFARAHRSHIVRLDAISAVQGADGERQIRLANGDAVPLSRRFAQARAWHCPLHAAGGHSGSAKAVT